MLADATAEALLEGTDRDRDEQLEHLAALLERFDVPRSMQARLAHYAYRIPSGLALWLRSTAALCRLVAANEEEPDELASRLVALAWGLGDADRRFRDVWRAEDADLIRRSEDLSFGIAKHLNADDTTHAEVRERRHLAAWLARLAGGAKPYN